MKGFDKCECISRGQMAGLCWYQERPAAAKKCCDVSRSLVFTAQPMQENYDFTMGFASTNQVLTDGVLKY